MTDLPVRRFIARDGFAPAYREIGAGRPLVLLHGFTADGSQWLDHGPAAALAEALPNARFARVPGDHFTALASPEFAAAVLDYV
ncbi:alpha/beta fold hydrolase [Amycolatopsis sp. CA-230715]|uniref:alpha/beta fold hydrolase n=1 Tax=Amycolatopsis sp. CA-230715 TaxID=2745196 RepID=UPI001C025D6B|nr:hypothetical protein [Amycolatopsis sp. CA-230715]QWF81349.1 hypothetical protein HUW46_04779 [Amycolatopsis sp. CA-230715]